MKNSAKCALISLLFAAIAVCFTVIVSTVDVAAIGPEGSVVGLSAMNGAVHSALGFNIVWYEVSELFGFLTLLFPVGFALYAIVVTFRERSVRSVGLGVWLVLALDVLVVVVYSLFELLKINFRPVVFEGGELEASFPSSHTLLALCFVIPSLDVFNDRVWYAENRILILIVSAALALMTIVARTLSGVHWLSDIIGGVLYSIAIVLLYYSAKIKLEELSERPRKP